MNAPGSDLKLRLLIQERTLGGEPPQPMANTGKSKQLAALGWRIVPVPIYWPTGVCTLETGATVPRVDFWLASEYLVIPPDNYPGRATKVRGRNPAIRWAWERAFPGVAA